MRKNLWAIFFVPLLFAGTALAHVGHEHSSGPASNLAWGFKGASELLNVHPLFVHFPIALLLASLVFYFLGLMLRKEELFAAGKGTLFLGTVSAGLAVWTGLQAAKTVSHDDEAHGIMMIHQYLGFGVLGLSVFLSLWLILAKAHFPSKKILFLIAFILLGLVVIQQADFGGRMVFMKGVGVGRKSMLVQEKESAGRHHDEYGGETVGHGHSH